MKIELNNEAIANFIFGHSFNPAVPRNGKPDPNATYTYIEWNDLNKCERLYKCEVHGSKLDYFIPTDQSCDGQRVQLIVRKNVNDGPTCVAIEE